MFIKRARNMPMHTHEAELELSFDPTISTSTRLPTNGQPAALCLHALYQQTDPGYQPTSLVHADEPPRGPEYDLLELYIFNYDAKEWRTFTTLDHKMLDAMFGPGTTDGIYEELEQHITTR